MIKHRFHRGTTIRVPLNFYLTDHRLWSRFKVSIEATVQADTPARIERWAGWPTGSHFVSNWKILPNKRISLFLCPFFTLGIRPVVNIVLLNPVKLPLKFNLFGNGISLMGFSNKIKSFPHQIWKYFLHIWKALIPPIHRFNRKPLKISIDSKNRFAICFSFFQSRNRGISWSAGSLQKLESCFRQICICKGQILHSQFWHTGLNLVNINRFSPLSPFCFFIGIIKIRRR